jgi:hypothetical protein
MFFDGVMSYSNIKFRHIILNRCQIIFQKVSTIRTTQYTLNTTSTYHVTSATILSKAKPFKERHWQSIPQKRAQHLQWLEIQVFTEDVGLRIGGLMVVVLEENNDGTHGCWLSAGGLSVGDLWLIVIVCCLVFISIDVGHWALSWKCRP